MNTKYTLSILAILFTFMAIGQPPSPPATPIDGGLGILLAGGAAYGIKKLKNRKK